MFPIQLLVDANYFQGFTAADDLSKILMLSFEDFLFWLGLCLSVPSCLQKILVVFSASVKSLRFFYLDTWKAKKYSYEIFVN